MENLYKQLIKEIGEDVEREGLVNTPKRAAKAMSFFTKGYSENIDTILNGALFETKSQEMVIVKNIEVYSLCEHHLVPFFGQVHVGYIPNGKIIGLSKIPRIVDVFARRLQVQENLTVQIAETLNSILNPSGVAVIMEAQHLCMMMRGVEKQHSQTTTSSMLGQFLADFRARSEFLSLIK